MTLQILARETLMAGEEIVVECPAPEGTFSVVFEDDGETGYFYALDMALEGNPICDALHIYTVENVADRHLPSTLEIGWSDDRKKAMLIINDFPHAVFDFVAKRGYCRSAFPPPSPEGIWSLQGHAWEDAVLSLFDVTP